MFLISVKGRDFLVINFLADNQKVFDIMVHNIKKGQYGEALYDGVDSLFKILKPHSRGVNMRDIILSIIWGIIFGCFLFVYVK